MINKRSLVIVFTDFLHKDKSVEEQFEPFRHMKYKQHEVILFYLNESKTEVNLEFENQFTIILLIWKLKKKSIKSIHNILK